jgi:hypothetical protein
MAPRRHAAPHGSSLRMKRAGHLGQRPSTCCPVATAASGPKGGRHRWRGAWRGCLIVGRRPTGQVDVLV